MFCAQAALLLALASCYGPLNVTSCFVLCLQVTDAAAVVLATDTVTEAEHGSQAAAVQHEASTAVAEAQQAQQAESPVALPKVGTASY